MSGLDEDVILSDVEDEEDTGLKGLEEDKKVLKYKTRLKGLPYLFRFSS